MITKILFIINSLVFGGAERQLVELIKGLHRRQKYDIHIVCLDDTIEGYGKFLSSLNLRNSIFPRKYRKDIRPVFSIARYIRENQIQIIHSFLNLSSLFGAFAAKLTKRPVVCSAIRSAKDNNKKNKLSVHLLSCLADILISNSFAGFNSRFKKMKPHFRVVFNGVDFNRFNKANINIAETKNELTINTFDHIIGMVASFSNLKDHETFIDVVPLVLRHFPNTCFILVGDGPCRYYIEKKVKRKSLGNNIMFLGFRSDADRISAVFNISILLTNTALQEEGTSNALIEAMALGIPVIATTGGGTEEFIQDNTNGLLVPPKSPYKTAEAIIGLLKDHNKAKQLAHVGQKLVYDKFNLSNYINEHEKIYRTLLT